MTLRRTDLLINDILFDSNNLGSNRYTALRLSQYFKRAQRKIHAFMFDVKKDGQLYPKSKVYDLTSGQEFVDLPADIYALNSVTSVERRTTDSAINYYTQLRLIDQSERRKSLGYAIYGKQVLISPIARDNLESGLRVTYERQLAAPSSRIGKISGVVGQVISMTGFSTEDITTFDDFVCVVDASGVIQNVDADGVLVPLQISSYNTSTGDLTIVAGADLSGFTTDMFVVLGKYATSHSDLPEECEEIILSYVKRMIEHFDSSSDLNTDISLSESERQIIENLFAKNNNDVFYPPIADSTYLT